LKIICFIGARGGSKGVPRKNIRKLGKKPLIAYAIESALKSKLFEHVIVSTDDLEIAKISKKYGAEVPFIRPKNLATDSTGFAEVMIHGINELKKLNYDFDILVNRDCTVPFIRINDMKKSIKLFKNKKPDAVYAVYKQHFNPYFNMMEKNPSGFLKLCKKLKSRPRSRQEAPKVYQLNGLFIFNVKKFLKYRNPILPKALPFEIPIETGHMIDTEIEFKIAEIMLKEKLISF
jgi:CMP-N,N'-diacetyllegionaminic acid synthase